MAPAVPGSAQADGLPAVVQTVEQHGDEDDAAHDADDELNGQLIGCDDHPGDHIAGQHEDRAKERRINQGAADFVPLEHGRQVGNNEADVGDGAHHDHHGGGNHRRNGQTHEQHKVIVDAQVLGEVLAHAHDVEVVGKHKSQGDQRNHQIDQLIPAPEDHGKVPHQPGGQGLAHLVLVGKVIGDAGDDVAEHDAHQGDHHRVLELDALDKPHKNPGSGDGKREGKQRTPPQRRPRQEQHRHQDAELGRRNGGACGGRDEFVHAQLLHDQASHTHADTGAQGGQQPGQAGDQENLDRFQISIQQSTRRDVQNADEQ